MQARVRCYHCTALVVVMAAALVLPVSAWAQDYSLFDKFSIALEGSWVNLDTNLRLDSKVFGIGTEIDFENDGRLSDSEVIPAVRFDWRPGDRHLVFGWWQLVDRDSTTQILTEIRFGDVVFPIDERVTFGFSTEEFALGYAFVPVLKERLALGVGLGVRTLKVGASLAAEGLELRNEGDFTGPLPFIDLDFRYGITPRLRFISRLGLLYLEIGDYSGGQYILDLSLEHLTFSDVSFGGGINGAVVDVDVDTSGYTGSAKIGIVGARLFVKLRM